jgi:RND superfamily putative drug exporter
MSSSLYRFGRACARHRVRVLAAWLVLLAVVGVLAGVTGMKLDNAVSIPGTEAQEGLDALAQRVPEMAGTSGQIVFVAPEGKRVSDYATEVAQVVGAASKLPDVRLVSNPLDTAGQGAVSPDGRYALAPVQLSVGQAHVRAATINGLKDAAALVPAADGLRVVLGGQIFTKNDVQVGLTEGLGVLVAILVLVVTFGSVLAAGLPLLTALVGVAMTVAAILIAAGAMTINATTPTLAVMIGLAVGIDYALFLVSRHRSQLAVGMDVEESIARATATAGSAVVFAGATVIIALCGLAVAQIPFLTIMGVAAAVGVAIAVGIALTAVPAMLAVAGERLRPRPGSRAAAHSVVAHGDNHTVGARWVALVTRRPLLTVIVVVLGLGVVALPARDLAVALPDNGSAPVGSTQREAYDLVAKGFGAGYNAPLLVTADIITSTDPVGAVKRLAADLATVHGVAGIALATPNASADLAIVEVIPTGGQTDASTATLVREIRAERSTLETRFGVTGLRVTGQAAVTIDVSDRLSGALLPFALVVVGLSLILLLAVFRSVAVPIKATLGYLLSVGAAFGVVSAVFEWGWLADAIHVAKLGPVIAFMPIIVMGVLFGLAMDYEVFLVSRMREDYVHTDDARRAVVTGFTGSARVVTAAAIIMLSVFAAFVPNGDVYVKPIAVGLGVGVAVDAFLIRMTLVPAVMMLLGKRAWWLPARWDRALPVLDIEGEGLHRELAAAERRAGEPELAVRARGLVIGGSRGAVVDDLDLDLAPRRLLVASGPPGTGKTALLLTLAGRMRPAGGELEVAGELLPDRSAAVQALAGLAEIHGINDLEPSVTVGQHVAERLTAATSRPWARSRDIDAVLAGAEQVFAAATGGPVTVAAGLVADRLVADLSPLERRVLGVALALVGGPRLVVVDDVDSLRSADDRRAFWLYLGRVADRTTVIASAQDPHEVDALHLRGAVLLDLGAVRPGFHPTAPVVSKAP